MTDAARFESDNSGELVGQCVAQVLQQDSLGVGGVMNEDVAVRFKPESSRSDAPTLPVSRERGVFTGLQIFGQVLKSKHAAWVGAVGCAGQLRADTGDGGGHDPAASSSASPRATRRSSASRLTASASACPEVAVVANNSHNAITTSGQVL